MPLTPPSKKLLAILDSGGERQIHQFLKRYPFLLQVAFARAWNANVCVPEFRLGSDFRTDFLVLSADSGLWHASFVELKSPLAKLYGKKGNPLTALRTARKQLQDCGNWIKLNESYLRQAFSKILRDRKEAAQCSSADRHTLGETEIIDPKTCIDFRYHILMGRRQALSDEERSRRANEFSFWGSPEIATYDRLVEIAKLREDMVKMDSLTT